jgi:nitrate reductase alpha subunit
VLGVEKDVVLTPMLHDTPANGAALRRQGLEEGRVRADPRQDHAAVIVVERDYPNLYKKFTALGPLMDKLGNGGKGIAWNTEHEVELLGAERRRHR